MQRNADSAISNNEREFIIQALKEDRRIDGRGTYEMREPKFQFSLDDSSCTVLLGRTRVMTVVAASLEAPYPDRPNEGSVRFNVEFSPMASLAFEAGRPGEEATEVARLIERGLRESRAVDQEALVVVSGRKVWHLRVDVHVLDHAGNLVDACGLSALGALMAFRRPDVTVGGGEDGQTVTIHSPEVREPLPLSIHHLPMPVSFAFFQDGALVVVDPGLKEEAASSGGLTVTLNPHGELCAVQKARGVGLPQAEILRCIRIAAQKVEDVTTKLKKALEAHAVARVQARVRRREPAPAAPAAAAPQQQQLAAAELPQPVQEMLARIGAEEEEEEGAGAAVEQADSEMAAAEAEGDGGALAPSVGEGEGRAAPGEDGAAAEGGKGDESPPQQAQQRPEAGPGQGGAGSREQQQRCKEKRKRRSAQLGGGGGGPAGAGAEPDQFELIASMIAGAGGQPTSSGGGLEGAVKQGGGGGKQRGQPGSSGKKGKGGGGSK